MAAKVDDPVQRREQMAIDLRKSKKQELLSKRRYPAYQDQSFIHALRSSTNSQTEPTTNTRGWMGSWRPLLWSSTPKIPNE